MTHAAGTRMRTLTAAVLCLLSGLAIAASDPLFTDPPHDPLHPARMMPVRIPSHDVAVNGVFYLAAGKGAHPTMVFFHGQPGNEQNLDLAQAVRRLGWNVLTLHPRGAWGSPGAYSYQHLVEDGVAAMAFVRDAKNISAFGINPKRIVLAGHSTGGFIAVNTAKRVGSIAGLILISASDDVAQALAAKSDAAKWQAFINEDLAGCGSPLAGCTGEELGNELLANAESWSFQSSAAAVSELPMLIVTSDDGLAPEVDVIAREAKHAKKVHMHTDHPYSDKRIALQRVVAEWLRSLSVKQK